MIFAESKEPGEEIPPEDASAAAPPPPPRRKVGQTRGEYGTRLSPADRKTMLETFKGGGTISAAAAAIGRHPDTIKRWREWGRAGKPGYVKLYQDIELAIGHTLRRLHFKVNFEATKETADGKLALALLDRLDPDFIKNRMPRHPEMSAEVVTGAATMIEGGAAAKAATKIAFKLTWDDGEPVRFPGLFSEQAVPALAAVAPGGNGDGGGNGGPPQGSASDDSDEPEDEG